MSTADRIPLRARLSGPAVILVATVAAGIASYVLTWLVPRVVGYAEYASFAVFWSTAYLIVGSLGGVQQEVARATRPRTPTAGAGASRSRNFALMAALAVAVLIAATAPAWVGAVFPGDEWTLVAPLAVAAAGYVVVAVVGGSLYGVAGWGLLATMITADAFLRLLLVGVVLPFSHDTRVLSWAVAIPFPLAVIILWPVLRRRIANRTYVDAGYGRLTWNVVRTIVATAATSLMVSGFPLLVGVTSRHDHASTVGLVILTTTLVRAPLIVVAMSFQSYLIVFYRDHPHQRGRVMLVLQACTVLGGALLGLLAWWLAAPVFELLFAGQPAPDGAFAAVLVFSSGLVAALCVTSPALLARGDHMAYTVGWAVGALATVGAMLLPLDLLPRVLVALCTGPVLGLVVELGYLLLSPGRGVVDSSPPSSPPSI